jgi:murein L,D-transpeptidase YcbB/YkuD
VRVQDPFQFAFNLLSNQEKDPQKKFQTILLTKQESQINFKEPIPVSLIYRTVFFGNYGQPQYRSDIYGRDAAVFMALQDVGVLAKI